MTKSKRIFVILGAVGLFLIVFCCGFPLANFWMSYRGKMEIDRAKFLETAATSDPRIVKMYELFPEAEARFNNGNRRGRRGAFAPIAETYTLSAKLPNGYELKLYRGIAPRIAAPDGITVVEGAYAVRSPKGQLADLTAEEFDEFLNAKGDVQQLKPIIWNRQPLPSKHLGREDLGRED